MMIRTKDKEWKPSCVNAVSENKICFLTLLILVPPAVYFDLSFWLGYSRFYGVEMCFADCFCKIADPTFWALIAVPFSVLVSMQLTKRDFDAALLMRRKSRQSLWARQCRRICFLCLAVSFYVLLCTAAIGALLTHKAMNWDKSSSLFYLYTRTITEKVSVARVIAVTAVLCFLVLFSANLFVLFLKWVTNSNVLGLACVTCLGFAECMGVNIYYSQTLRLYHKWLGPIQAEASVMLPALCIVVICCTGLLLSDRKDFLGEHQR